MVSIFMFYMEVIRLMKEGRRSITLKDCKEIFKKLERGY